MRKHGVELLTAKFLVRHFVKDYDEIEKVSVRTAYGVPSSIAGIFCNITAERSYMGDAGR